MFVHPAAADRARLGRDLVEDRMVRFIDRTFVLWAVLGFVLPFALGYALTGRHLEGRAHRACCGAAWCGSS